jgi:P27 family predicted phage terminase small subunit
MGLRGPAPKPTALKVLDGNPGRRPLNHDEPKPRPVAPACPAWLAPEAKREWRRIAPVLERLGLLTEIDGAALAGYCQSYARWRQCQEAIQRDGLTFETATGYLAPRPEVAIGNKALAEVRAFCVQFGLTPSARSRMQLQANDHDDQEASPFDV